MKLLYHDDDCDEFLDHLGFCHKCKLHPDMQSTAFREPTENEIKIAKNSNKLFLGFGRKIIKL